MTYREIRPEGPAREFVDRYWVLESDASEAGSVQRVVPDGTAQLILNFAQPFENYQDGEWRLHRVVFWPDKLPDRCCCGRLGRSRCWASAFSGPENLKIEEVALREPGAGEVKLRVQAVGLNRAEPGFMHGQYFETPQLPSRIGYEASGIVEAVGPGVDASWVGKPVATVPGFSMNKNGVLGEEAVVPADSLGEYPPKLSPVEAAAIWMQYLTAYGALITYGALKPGNTGDSRCSRRRSRSGPWSPKSSVCEPTR
jgi:hypothetical protein